MMARQSIDNESENRVTAKRRINSETAFVVLLIVAVLFGYAFGSDVAKRDNARDHAARGAQAAETAH